MASPKTKRWVAVPELRMSGSFPMIVEEPFPNQEQAAEAAIEVLEDDSDEEVVYICYIVGVVRRPKGQYVPYEQARKEKVVE